MDECTTLGARVNFNKFAFSQTCLNEKKPIVESEEIAAGLSDSVNILSRVTAVHLHCTAQ